MNIEFIKRVVLAWDSDFTKLTVQERLDIEQSETDFKNGHTYTDADVHWK